ncbi:MAG: hypothetical protein IJS25_00750, partial [Bacteroidales bacterium]|nr:hypothetical protein [Bacteroidales bacterium]
DTTCACSSLNIRPVHPASKRKPRRGHPGKQQQEHGCHTKHFSVFRTRMRRSLRRFGRYGLWSGHGRSIGKIRNISGILSQGLPFSQKKTAPPTGSLCQSEDID